MNCADIERRVALYAGGDLDEASAPDVERHLAACVGCRSLLTELRADRAAMGEWRVAAPGQDALDDVRSSVLAAIARGDARQSVFDRVRFAPSGSVVWRSAGLAAAALLVFAVWATVFRPQDAKPVREATAPPTRAETHAAVVPAPRAADATKAPAERRAEARREMPAPSAGAIASAQRRSVMRPQLAAAGTGSAVLTLAAGPLESVDNVRAAADTSNAPAGPIQRIEFQTADPNIRIIWLMPERAPDPNRSGAAGR